jgi:hypothetical protein
MIRLDFLQANNVRADIYYFSDDVLEAVFIANKQMSMLPSARKKGLRQLSGTAVLWGKVCSLHTFTSSNTSHWHSMPLQLPIL